MFYVVAAMSQSTHCILMSTLVRSMCRIRVFSRLALVGILFWAFGSFQMGWAQTQVPSLTSERQPVRIAIDPTYQHYETEEDHALTEASTWLTAAVPIGRRFNAHVRVGYAQMGSDSLAQVRGLTDASVTGTYAQPVGDGSVVFALRVNAPMGKQELSEEETVTSRLISENFYDFRVTSFSRGLAISPQITWAVPVGDRFALGIGAGYQHQRGYRPQANLEDPYVPGDGLGANGGVDYRVTDQSALGLDVTYRRYRPDRVGESRRFDAGSRVAGTIRYLIRSGFTTGRIVARYASWEESEFGYELMRGPDRDQVLPPHGMILGSYRTRLSQGTYLRMRLSGHWYGETLQSREKWLGRVRVQPSVELGDILTVAPHVQVTAGSYLGVSGGVRLEGKF